MRDNGVQAFFDRYAEAISANDLDGIAACYAYPSLAVSRLGRVAIGDAEQVRQFFGQGAERYRARGIERVEIREVRAAFDEDGLWLGSAHLVNHDGNGAVVDVERNAYQLVRGDGEWKIAVTTPLDAR